MFDKSNFTLPKKTGPEETEKETLDILAVSMVLGLSLNQASPKPRVTKFSPTTEASRDLSLPPSTTTADSSGVAIYRFRKYDYTCILLKTDAVVEVKFRLHDLEEQADSFVPNKVTVEGNCDDYSSFITLSWPGYSLIIFFAKTPGGQRWFINKITLLVSPDVKGLQGVEVHGSLENERKSPIELHHTSSIIPTPVGKSFTCKELEIELTPNEKDNPPSGIYGTLFLRLLQVQPFKDETAPIAVGSTLAIAVVVT
ncbi:hypothetical protein NQ317_009427, partial [Molorchus minor]